MTNTVAAPGDAPAGDNLFARLVGVLTSPRATFEKVAARPRFLGVLVITTLLVAVFTAMPMTTDAGREALLNQQVKSMKAFGVDVNDQVIDRMERQDQIAPYTTAGSIIVITPIIAAIMAGLFFAIFNAGMGGEATFKQVYAVVVHAGVISTAGSILSGIVNYFQGGTGSVANLGALLPMLPEGSFLTSLLGMVDVFAIWWVIALSIGLGVLYKKRTQPIAIGLFAIYALIAIVVAVFKSRAGAA